MSRRSPGAQEATVSSSTQELLIELRILRETTDFKSPARVFYPYITPELFYKNSHTILTVTNKLEIAFLSSSLTSHLTAPSSFLTGPPLRPVFEQFLNENCIDYTNDPCNYLVNADEEWNFKPHGVCLHTFELDLNGTPKTFQIFVATFKDKAFRQYHKRMEIFAMLFIDGANRIDDDEKWVCFQVYEIEKDETDLVDLTRYHFVGYSSSYKFFAYPSGLRPRISQFVILPEFQRVGIGQQLLFQIYAYFCADPKVTEITVEDPCEEFLRMRDVVDVERVIFKNNDQRCFDRGRQPYTRRFVDDFHQQFAIPHARVRRIYELVRLYYIRRSHNLHNQRTLLADFKQELIKRLQIDHLRTQSVTNRARDRCKYLNNRLSSSDQSWNVNAAYSALMEEYRAIVAKVERDIRRLAKKEAYNSTSNDDEREPELVK